MLKKFKKNQIFSESRVIFDDPIPAQETITVTDSEGDILANGSEDDIIDLLSGPRDDNENEYDEQRAELLRQIRVSESEADQIRLMRELAADDILQEANNNFAANFPDGVPTQAEAEYNEDGNPEDNFEQTDPEFFFQAETIEGGALDGIYISSQDKYVLYHMVHDGYLTEYGIFETENTLIKDNGSLSGEALLRQFTSRNDERGFYFDIEDQIWKTTIHRVAVPRYDSLLFNWENSIGVFLSGAHPRESHIIEAIISNASSIYGDCTTRRCITRNPNFNTNTDNPFTSTTTSLLRTLHRLHPPEAAFIPATNQRILSNLQETLELDPHHELANILINSTVWLRPNTEDPQQEFLIYRNHDTEENGILTIQNGQITSSENSDIPQVNSSPLDIPENDLFNYILTSHLDRNGLIEHTQDAENEQEEVDNTVTPDTIDTEMSISNFAGFGSHFRVRGDHSQREGSDSNENYFLLDLDQTHTCEDEVYEAIRVELDSSNLNDIHEPPLSESQINRELDAIAEETTSIVIENARFEADLNNENELYFNFRLGDGQLNDMSVRIETPNLNSYQNGLETAVDEQIESLSERLPFSLRFINTERIVNRLGHNGTLPENVSMGSIALAILTQPIAWILNKLGPVGEFLSNLLGLEEVDADFETPDEYSVETPNLEYDNRLSERTIQSNWEAESISDELISIYPRHHYLFTENVILPTNFNRSKPWNNLRR